MSEIRYHPIRNGSNRAIVGIVERQNLTGHAKVLGVMDVDEYVIHSVACINKDQAKLPSLVAQPGQGTICRRFYNNWWLATHSLVALLGLDTSCDIGGLVVDTGHGAPASHHSCCRKPSPKPQIRRVFA